MFGEDKASVDSQWLIDISFRAFHEEHFTWESFHSNKGAVRWRRNFKKKKKKKKKKIVCFDNM
jgi:hypothetical protein